MYHQTISWKYVTGSGNVLISDYYPGICPSWRFSEKPRNTSVPAAEVRAEINDIYIYIYKVSQEECARLREGVAYVKVYQYNPKHLCPKLNGYGDNGQRKVWSSGGSTHCTCQLTVLSMSVLECGVMTAIQLTPALNCICTSFRVMT